MKLQIRWQPIVSLVIVACLLAVPVSALGKKGKDHFERGMKAEQALQWEKAAQEFGKVRFLDITSCLAQCSGMLRIHV